MENADRVQTPLKIQKSYSLQTESITTHAVVSDHIQSTCCSMVEHQLLGPAVLTGCGE